MTHEDIDKMWGQALNEPIKNGEDFTRYRFAKLVVANIDPKSFMSWQEGYEAGMETAAVICDNVAGKYQHAHNASSENIADECAGTIRAKGTT